MSMSDELREARREAMEMRAERNKAMESLGVVRTENQDQHRLIETIYAEPLLEWVRVSGWTGKLDGIDHGEAMKALISAARDVEEEIDHLRALLKEAIPRLENSTDNCPDLIERIEKATLGEP